MPGADPGRPAPGGPRPGVSVVTPSRNNVSGVLGFLHRMTVSAARSGASTEIIVVDDSLPEPADRIRAACREYGASYLRGPRRVGAKRNVGAAHARYDIILFVDSDCVPTDDLVAEHIRPYRADKGARIGAVAGPVLPPARPSGAAARAMHVNAPFDWAAVYGRLGWAPTANLSVSAEAFRSIGGFDEETFTVNGGEDVDLGVRLCAAGWTIVGSPRATVGHGTAAESFRSLVRKVSRYGRADVYLRTRHPSRAEPYLNRAALATAVTGLGIAGSVVLRSWWPALGLAAAGWAGAAASLPRRPLPAGSRARLTDTCLAAMVDLSFDAGTLVQAVQRRRPGMALGKFLYQVPGEFVEHARRAHPDVPEQSITGERSEAVT